MGVSSGVDSHFNPRLREGGDIRFGFTKKRVLHFNPRLREGGDVISVCMCLCMRHFNPRLREGGDVAGKWERVITLNISIHASAKEATATYCDTSAIMYISSLNNFFVHFF